VTAPAQSSLARQERLLVFCALTCAVVYASGEHLWAHLPDVMWLSGSFLWLLAAVMCAAFAVVRHAEQVAEILGEPLGTLILTLSVTVIEVICVSAVMLHGEQNPTLARDTLFAVVMLILNGMVGLSLLIGGIKHLEQDHNLQGANVYLVVAIPLIVLSLVLPNFTQTTPGPTLSHAQEAFLVVVSIGLYGVFLRMQTGRYRDYFSLIRTPRDGRHEPHDRRHLLRHTVFLLAYLGLAVALAEKLARPIDYAIESLHAPSAFGGLVMAVLVATAEAVGAVRAAIENQMQRSVNIFLGSILSTIGITIPAMILISRLTGQEIVLGVDHADLVMLLLTLAVSMVTFSMRRTNAIHGLVHLLLFGAYLMLIFQD
jgi:Ca2+:H+ antiporter